MTEPLDYRNEISTARRRPPPLVLPLCRVIAIACSTAIAIEFWRHFNAEDSIVYVWTELLGGFALLILPGIALRRYRLNTLERGTLIVSIVIGVLSLAASLLMARLWYN